MAAILFGASRKVKLQNQRSDVRGQRSEGSEKTFNVQLSTRNVPSPAENLGENPAFAKATARRAVATNPKL
jgi:hypothetical protein